MIGATSMRIPGLIIAASFSIFANNVVVDATKMKDIQAGFYYSAYFTNQGDKKSSRDTVYHSLLQSGFDLYGVDGKYYIKSHALSFPVVIMEPCDDHLKIVDFVDLMPSGGAVLIGKIDKQVNTSVGVNNFKVSDPDKFCAIRNRVVESIKENFKISSGVLYVSPINISFPEFYVLFESREGKSILRFSLDNREDLCGFIGVLPYSKRVADFVKARHIERIVLSAASIGSKN